MMIDKLKRKLKKSIVNVFTRNIENDKELDYKQAKDMMLSDNAILLDVRSVQEYNEFHLQGAICIPVYDLYRNAYKILSNKNQTIIIYCQTGHRSSQAVEILSDLGYTSLYEILGGLDEM